MILLTLFWTALALIVYSYLLFPLIVAVRGLLRCRPHGSAPITPRVSMIISAYNEAGSIRAKLENILALDYPRDRLEVWIASDGSTDGTDDIVRQYSGDVVRLLSLPRQGKAAALNTAVAETSGEILVFSDANSMYAPDAIRALAAPFADPEVGGVAGNQCYLADRDGVGSKMDIAGDAGAGERSYWSIDRLLKRAQSRSGHAISATGAIYAIRRSLFHGVPAGVTDDFYISTRVIAQGYRLVFAANAVAYEPVAATSGHEFGRKVRVMTRGLRGVITMRELLNPFRYGFYAVQLFSHKVLRRTMVLPLIALLVTNPFLLDHGWFYQAMLVAQIILYGSALLQMLLAHTRLGRARVLTIPSFFCMVNGAALLAIWNILRGHRIDRWEPKHEVGR